MTFLLAFDDRALRRLSVTGLCTHTVLNDPTSCTDSRCVIKVTPTEGFSRGGLLVFLSEATEPVGPYVHGYEKVKVKVKYEVLI